MRRRGRRMLEPKQMPVLIRTPRVTVYMDLPEWRGGMSSMPDGSVALNGRPLSDRDMARGWALTSEYQEAHSQEVEKR